ncbi:MAG TPA: hypothetical protein VJU61_03685, partial [Polyangiaceae bacterium]|nr:hypothetical protein [Polyangiaceae bacterium]
AHAGLLALPRGGALIHWGNALFRLGAGGELEGYAELKGEVVETLVDGDRIWLVGANGEVWTWNGRDPPARRGGFPSQVSAAALSAPGRLLAVVDGHDLVQWTAATGPSVTLAQVEELGGAPRISAPGGDSVYLLGSGGIPLSVPSGAPPATPSGSAPAPTTVPDRASDLQRIPAGSGEVLASRDGSVAWLVPNTPLGLRRSAGKPRLFPEVQCHQPLSLVPAGGQRFVASCKSGEIWMIGPPASSGLPSTPEPSPSAPVR